jgi:hypothetical protein
MIIVMVAVAAVVARAARAALAILYNVSLMYLVLYLDVN